MRVQPAPGLLIRDPITKQHIPSDGYDVPDDDFYWARRLRDGDVVIAKAAGDVVIAKAAGDVVIAKAAGDVADTATAADGSTAQ